MKRRSDSAVSLVGRRLAAVGAVLVVAALVLGGCGVGPAETVSTPSAALETSTTAGVDSQTPASTAAPAAAPVPGAYVGAGGPRPADATPLPTYAAGGVKSAHLSSPSGGIKCDFQVTDSSGYQGQCGVRAYATSSPYGCTTLAGGVCKGKWLFPFQNDRVGEIHTTQGTTGWMNVTPSTGYTIPTVAYGKVVYFDNWVCASAYNGLTCWNTATGSGVFLSNERSETFTGPGSSATAPTAAPTATQAPAAAPDTAAIVLGAASAGRSGYGTARPSALDNGGSRTGMVDQITWSSWGGDRANGTGRAFNATGEVAAGAPASYAVTVVALDPGDCNGQRAYRKLLVFKPDGYLNPANAVDVCGA